MTPAARKAIATPPPMAAPPGGIDWIAWLGVAFCSAAALLAALVESFLIPLYVGTVLVPLAPVLAVLGNILLPVLGRQAVGRLAGGVLPYLAWLIVVLLLSGITPSPGEVIYVGGSGGLPWVSYGVVLGGAFAGAITLVVSSPLQAGRPPPAGSPRQ